MSFSVMAQSGKVTMPVGEISAQTVFENIRQQTDFLIAADGDRTTDLRVKITRPTIEVRALLDQLLRGSGMSYQMNGNYIIIKGLAEINTPIEPRVAYNSIVGTIIGAYNVPLKGVTIEMIDVPGHSVTDANGYFRIDSVSAGLHIVKLSLEDSSMSHYHEVNVPEQNDVVVTLTYVDEIPSQPTPQPTKSEAPAVVVTAIPMLQQPQKEVLPEMQMPPQQFSPAITTIRQSTDENIDTYFVPSRVTNTLRMQAGGQKAEMLLVPNTQLSRASRPYLPKSAIKTNLLVLGATTLNVSLELGLARRWSIDMQMLYNPFQVQKGGSNLLWFVQPEFRYWFCQRFERHYIGLHGHYGAFNVGKIDFLTTTFREHRYKGWGAGAGLSWGYHLPMGKRWAWEFSLGAGFVYFDYDKYKCYECDELLRHNAKLYLGPTKAAVSLIFMIK